MTDFRAAKVVAAVPSPPEPDTVYFVRAGSGFDLYVTNGVGVPVAYKLNGGSSTEDKEPVMLGQIVEFAAIEEQLVVDGMTFLRQGYEFDVWDTPDYPSKAVFKDLTYSPLAYTLTGATDIRPGKGGNWVAFGSSLNYISRDDGRTWDSLGIPAGYNANDTNYAGAFVKAKAGSGKIDLLFSWDSGETWESQEILWEGVSAVYKIVWNPHYPRILIATNLGFAVTTNNGATWSTYTTHPFNVVDWLGAEWVAKTTNTQIWRVSPNGAVTAIAIPAQITAPYQLTTMVTNGNAPGRVVYFVTNHATYNLLQVGSNYQGYAAQQTGLVNSFGYLPVNLAMHPKQPTAWVNYPASQNNYQATHYINSPGVTKLQLAIKPALSIAISEAGTVLGLRNNEPAILRGKYLVSAGAAQPISSGNGKYVRIK